MFVRVAVELPLVMPMVAFTGAAGTLRLVVSRRCWCRSPSCCQRPHRPQLVTTLLSETVSAFQSSLSRVFPSRTVVGGDLHRPAAIVRGKEIACLQYRTSMKPLAPVVLIAFVVVNIDARAPLAHSGSSPSAFCQGLHVGVGKALSSSAFVLAFCALNHARR